MLLEDGVCDLHVQIVHFQWNYEVLPPDIRLQLICHSDDHGIIDLEGRLGKIVCTWIALSS